MLNRFRRVKISPTRVAIGIVFIVALFVIGSTLKVGTASPTSGFVPATSMTKVTGSGSEICLNGDSATTQTFYSAEGPSAKTWTILLYLSLENGDSTQYVFFMYNLYDNSNGNLVGSWGGPIYNWISVGDAARSTVTAEIGGTFELTLYIDNDDGSSQCFGTEAQPYYF
jgi:hypothetical protein